MRSAKLWYIKRMQKLSEEMIDLAKYERDFCYSCPRSPCDDMDDFELCYKTYRKKTDI